MAITQEQAFADLKLRLVRECLDGDIPFGNMVHAIQRSYQEVGTIRHLMPTMDDIFTLCVEEIERRREKEEEGFYLLGIPKSMIEDYLPPNMTRVRVAQEVKVGDLVKIDTVEVEPVGAPVVHGIALERIDIGAQVQMRLDNGEVRLRRQKP